MGGFRGAGRQPTEPPWDEHGGAWGSSAALGVMGLRAAPQQRPEQHPTGGLRCKQKRKTLSDYFGDLELVGSESPILKTWILCKLFSKL